MQQNSNLPGSRCKRVWEVKRLQNWCFYNWRNVPPSNFRDHVKFEPRVLCSTFRTLQYGTILLKTVQLYSQWKYKFQCYINWDIWNGRLNVCDCLVFCIIFIILWIFLSKFLTFSIEELRSSETCTHTSVLYTCVMRTYCKF